MTDLAKTYKTAGGFMLADRVTLTVDGRRAFGYIREITTNGQVVVHIPGEPPDLIVSDECLTLA